MVGSVVLSSAVQAHRLQFLTLLPLGTWLDGQRHSPASGHNTDDAVLVPVSAPHPLQLLERQCCHLHSRAPAALTTPAFRHLLERTCCLCLCLRLPECLCRSPTACESYVFQCLSPWLWLWPCPCLCLAWQSVSTTSHSTHAAAKMGADSCQGGYACVPVAVPVSVPLCLCLCLAQHRC